MTRCERKESHEPRSARARTEGEYRSEHMAAYAALCRLRRARRHRYRNRHEGERADRHDPTRRRRRQYAIRCEIASRIRQRADAWRFGCIDPTKDTIVARYFLTGCESNHGLYLDQAHRKAYIACEDNARLVVFDLTSLRHDNALRGGREWHRLYVLGVLEGLTKRRSGVSCQQRARRRSRPADASRLLPRPGRDRLQNDRHAANQNLEPQTRLEILFRDEPRLEQQSLADHSSGKTRKTQPTSAINAPLITSPYFSNDPNRTRCRPAVE